MAGPLRSFRDAVNLSPCSSVVWQPGHAAVSTPPPLPWRRMPRPGPAPAATATRAPGGARASQTQLRACAAPAGAAATSQTSCSPVLRPRSHAAPSPTLSVALESVNGRGISTTCCLAIPSPRVRAEGPRAQKPAYLSQHPSTSAGSPAGSPTPRRARVGRRSRGNRRGARPRRAPPRGHLRPRHSHDKGGTFGCLGGRR